MTEVSLRDFLSGIHVRRAHFKFACGLDPFVKDVMRKAFPEPEAVGGAGAGMAGDPTAGAATTAGAAAGTVESSQRLVSQQVTARLYRAQSAKKRPTRGGSGGSGNTGAGDMRPLSSATRHLSGSTVGRHGASIGGGLGGTGTGSSRGITGKGKGKRVDRADNTGQCCKACSVSCSRSF